MNGLHVWGEGGLQPCTTAKQRAAGRMSQAEQSAAMFSRTQDSCWSPLDLLAKASVARDGDIGKVIKTATWFGVRLASILGTRS